ncbi:hypothetical protein BU24DRAFT_358501 [Aaosphaeria arxii CBS 175.79]|uniref:Uncharacterized protein n=1 Tax=Aaosphaeria arxii CBS 175.79 TaxID=1450172 RepID=A0A6A5X9B7_9PLEO|nr:uncharacterized protein BU24DRAFT_358501 [Aaosphaeria arxii CBS 175.79]KAF2009541.1 hypothetical protein BU24DRAFT_358501 [Aaosphaeria arxii CBS 175.79]
MGIKHSNLQYYFAFSFVGLLALRYFNNTYFSIPNYIALSLCSSHDHPNPVASLYPMNATGTLNGTVAIIPISLALARQLIPPQYGILEHAYRALLPSFPQGMYPAVVQALHDHEVQAFGYKIPDFSRTGVEFPFVDMLNDNQTSFKWAPSLLMTSNHDIALKGAMDYGTTTFAAKFEPSCDAYRHVPNATDPGTTFFSAISSDPGAASLSTLFSPTEESPFPLSFFQNFTNQPTFADGKTCDNMIRFFNTSATTSRGIEVVKGTVRAHIPPFDAPHEWKGVYGLRMGTAFVENNYLPCENFRGYDGWESR